MVKLSLTNGVLQDAFEDLFFQYVKQLEKQGMVEHEEVFIDGTKIESKANRYQFVWLSNVIRQLEKVKEKAKTVLQPEGNLTLKKVQRAVDELDQQIQREKIEVKRGRGHHKPEIVRRRDTLQELSERWQEYERKKSICGEGRNSYAKTDPDATFMHMKEDHMRNGQLKPGYNVQFAVNSGFVTGIGVFPNRTDFGTLKPFLEYLQKNQGMAYKKVVADSGYESLANYRFLKEQAQVAYIKPANYEVQKKRSFKAQVGRVENMGFFEPDDCFICQNGRHLDHCRDYVSRAKDGTERQLAVYRCEDCTDCPYRAACCKAKDPEQPKEISVCWELYSLRQEASHTFPRMRENCCAVTALFRRKAHSDS